MCTKEKQNISSQSFLRNLLWFYKPFWKVWCQMLFTDLFEVTFEFRVWIDVIIVWIVWMPSFKYPWRACLSNKKCPNTSFLATSLAATVHSIQYPTWEISAKVTLHSSRLSLSSFSLFVLSKQAKHLLLWGNNYYIPFLFLLLTTDH